ncbi:MAG: hypothetical protein H8E35_03330, partial [Ardenticatenia bacterium]|nr:hypothetical protein [Ardenticatenia bacterium]
LNAQGKQSAYYYPPGRAGTIMLTILPRRPDHAETVPLLLGLLEFVRGNAGLGAKTNLGYGLFEWQAPAPEGLPDAVTFAAGIARRAGVGRRGNSERWPDLSEMFFAEVRLERPWQPMHFANFKYDLREALRDGPTIERLLPNAGQRRQLRHFLLGTVKSDPNQASKIKMALLPEQRTLRVWGWVPERLPAGAPREPVLSIVHAQVGQSGAITRWREFHSSRDTIGLFTDPEAYLRSLMEG